MNGKKKLAWAAALLLLVAGVVLIVGHMRRVNTPEPIRAIPPNPQHRNNRTHAAKPRDEGSESNESSVFNRPVEGTGMEQPPTPEDEDEPDRPPSNVSKAIFALAGQAGIDEVVKQLDDSISEKDFQKGEVAFWAMILILKKAGKEGTQRMANLLEQASLDSLTKRNMIIAIGYAGGEDAENLLIGYLFSSSKPVKAYWILSALETTASNLSIEAGVEHFKDDDDIPTTPDEQPLPYSDSGAQFGKIPSRRTIDALLQYWSQNESNREESRECMSALGSALEYLKKQGGETNQSLMETITKRLFATATSSQDPVDVDAALRGLQYTELPEVASLIAQKMANDPSARVRMDAATVVGCQGWLRDNPAIFEALCAVARTDPDENVRGAAVSAVWAPAPNHPFRSRIIQVKTFALQNDQAEMVRRTAADGLRLYGSEVLPVLETAQQNDSSKLVQEAAARSIKFIKDSEKAGK